MALRTVVETLKAKAILYAPEGQPFVLSSGKTSPYYIDVRRASLDAAGLYCLVQHLHHKIRTMGLEAQHVAGVALGGCPLASGVSLFSYALAKEAGRSVPVYDTLYVRKEAKGHGTGQHIEGAFKQSDTVILLEDVVTSGASTLRGIDVLRGAGLNVVGAISVLDRCEGGAEAIKQAGVPFDALVTLPELLG